MRQLILFTLLAFSVTTYGKGSKWLISLQAQPELTFYKDGYSSVEGNSNKSTFNLGIVSTIQYNINKRFFANAGVGFISRTLQTANWLNQAALPPPNQSFSAELVTTKSISYRVLSFPVNVGYNFWSTNRFKSFVTSGFAGNYLLNTYYRSNFSRYDGAYKKNYWQGYTVNLGLGTDYMATKAILATFSISYAIINKVREDEYIIDKNGNVTLTHNFLNLNIGIKIPL